MTDTHPAGNTPPFGDDPMAGIHLLGDVIDTVGAADRVANCAAALRIRSIERARLVAAAIQQDRTLVRFTGDAESFRAFVSEIALMLRIPDRTAEAVVERGKILIADLPATMSALDEGAISDRHAYTMVDATLGLTDNDRATFEAQALPKAFTQTVATFKRYTKTLRARLHPETLVEDRRAAMADRSVILDSLPHGMAALTIITDAVDLVGIYNATVDAAEALHREDGETRTHMQLMTDVLRDKLADGTVLGPIGNTTGAHAAGAHAASDASDAASGQPSESGSAGRYRTFQPRVMVMVPALSLLGKSDEPAILEGYGPIDIETATQLAGEAPTWTRLLTDPENGSIIAMSSKKYRPPADLVAAVRMRDGTCRHPGCNRSARDCEIDHSVAWQHGGATTLTNLECVCKKDHRGKHFQLVDPNGNVVGTAMKVEHVRDEFGNPNGVIRWITATGHAYLTEPQVRVRAPRVYFPKGDDVDAA